MTRTTYVMRHDKLVVKKDAPLIDLIDRRIDELAEKAADEFWRLGTVKDDRGLALLIK